MDQVSMDTFLSLVARHFLTTFGGAVVAAGYSGGATQQEVTGAGMVLLGVGLSWWNKRGYAMAMSHLKGFEDKVGIKGIAANYEAKAEHHE